MFRSSTTEALYVNRSGRHADRWGAFQNGMVSRCFPVVVYQNGLYTATITKI